MNINMPTIDALTELPPLDLDAWERRQRRANARAADLARYRIDYIARGIGSVLAPRETAYSFDIDPHGHRTALQRILDMPPHVAWPEWQRQHLNHWMPA